MSQTGQRFVFDMGSGRYKREIARARTFGFTKDVDDDALARPRPRRQPRQRVVVDEYKVLNSDGLRYDDEFVKHKILDAIGDMMIAGQPLLAAYTRVQVGPRAQQHAWCAPCSPTRAPARSSPSTTRRRAPAGLAELAPAW